MNLVKLLKVGQSLQSGKTIFGRYKLTQQSLLPKFGSTVRPAPPEAVVALPQTPQVSREVASPNLVAVEAKWIAPAPAELKPSIAPTSIALEQTQKIPAGQVLRRVEQAAPQTPEISLAARVWSKLGQKITSLKQCLVPARSKRKPFSTPVQTEWSLEKVTVVRNDLSEADLEVISPKATGIVLSRRVMLPDLNTVKNSGRSWIKKTAGLFQSNSPFETEEAQATQEVASIQAEKHAETANRV